MGIGLPELILILVILLLLGGASQLPKLARSMRQASKEFKRGENGGTPEVEAPKHDAAQSSELASGLAGQSAESPREATSWPRRANRPSDTPR